MMKAEQATRPGTKTTTKGWLARLGWAGFLFFLIKGLVWVAVFLGAGSLFVD